MGSPKRAAASVGRVGLLAAALGVGAAILTGTGVASADATDSAGTAPGRDSAAASPRTGTQNSGTQRSTIRPTPAQTRRSNSAAAPAAAAAVRDVSVAPAATTLTTVPAAVTNAVTNTVTNAVTDAGDQATQSGDAPENPAANSALWAMTAVSRRESTRSLRTATTAPPAATAATAAPAATAATAAAVASPRSLASSHIGWVTGQRNTAIPGLGWPQTNNTQWAGIYGTDLGIMWFNGENGLTQLAFGDTFSGPNMTGDWRSNVLLLSEDTQLYNGLSLINTGYAYQFIPAARDAVFFIGSEVTNIPSSAVYANGENYVNYFSVKSWDTPGRWTTNYSAISMYDPAADRWVLQRSTIRSAGWFRSSTPYVAGSQNFQQMAYVLQPEDQVAPGGTRYLYAFGTPAGRAGSAFLSRVPEGAITDLGQYEYWDGSTWVRDRPAVAAPVIGDSTNSTGLFGCIIDLANNPNFFGGWFAGFTGAKTGGNVSEMSVQYNEYLDKYVVMYGDGLNNIQLRTADTPEGPWSDPIQVASSLQYPGLYAPMIHPLSGTGQLTDANGDPDVSTLYWNMSLWGNYNVVLMDTDLAPLHTTLV